VNIVNYNHAALARRVFAGARRRSRARIRRRVAAYYSHRAAALSTHSYHYYSAAGRSHYLKERKKNGILSDWWLSAVRIYIISQYTHTRIIIIYVYVNRLASLIIDSPFADAVPRRPVDDAKEAHLFGGLWLIAIYKHTHTHSSGTSSRSYDIYTWIYTYLHTYTSVVYMYIACRSPPRGWSSSSSSSSNAAKTTDPNLTCCTPDDARPNETDTPL